MSTSESHTNQNSNAADQYSSVLSHHLNFPSWADEELAKYEAGSLRSNLEQSIRLDQGNTSNERKHIKAGKRRVKREAKKYEQKRGISSHVQHLVDRDRAV